MSLAVVYRWIVVVVLDSDGESAVNIGRGRIRGAARLAAHHLLLTKISTVRSRGGPSSDSSFLVDVVFSVARRFATVFITIACRVDVVGLFHLLQSALRNVEDSVAGRCRAGVDGFCQRQSGRDQYMSGRNH